MMCCGDLISGQVSDRFNRCFWGREKGEEKEEERKRERKRGRKKKKKREEERKRKKKSQGNKKSQLTWKYLIQ